MTDRICFKRERERMIDVASNKPHPRLIRRLEGRTKVLDDPIGQGIGQLHRASCLQKPSQPRTRGLRMRKADADALHMKRIEEVFRGTMRAIEEVRLHPPRDGIPHMVIVSGTIHGVVKAAATLAAREPALHGHEAMVFGDVAASFRQFYDEEKSACADPADRSHQP